jgi:hypothetical protein
VTILGVSGLDQKRTSVMREYVRDEDYRYADGRFKRRDGTWMPLPRPRYYLMRYTWRLSHYSIWVRLEFEEGIKRPTKIH